MHLKASGITCPKCKGNEFTLSDYTVVENLRYFINGKWDGDSNIEPGGMLNKVGARCHVKRCGHTWNIRGVINLGSFEDDLGA